MNILSVYHKEIPSFLIPYMHSQAMQRLKGIDMNCGMNFTSVPLFHNIQTYSRYDHSVGVALIVWHFTSDPVQTLAGLFHDISTPAFSHVVDFMKGDHEVQEANENETSVFIQKDPEIMNQLKRDGIDPVLVSDYHRYPIADNESPKLSADRLEYIFGDTIDYDFGTEEDIRKMYADLTVLKDEEGTEEIGFLHSETAVRFAEVSLQCGRVYAGREDRYAMERLSDLLKECISDRTLTGDNLYDSEQHVIEIICSSSHRHEWERFSALSGVESVNSQIPGARMILVKRRYVDPLIRDQGRVSENNRILKRKMEDFLNEDMHEWLKGDTF